MSTRPSTTYPHTALSQRDRALSTTSPALTTTDQLPRARKRALSNSPPRSNPSHSAPPSVPARSVLKHPIPPPRLPVLTRLHCCCFQRVLHEGPLSVVVLASVAGEQRVIKIYAPTTPGHRDALTHEYRAYAALVHHRISVPPSSVAPRPAVPYCYGILKIRTPDQLFRNCSSAEYQLFKNLHIFHNDRPLCGLVLEYIPNAASIAEDPSRLTPQLAFRAVQALWEIHKAGVLHVDHWPRNIVIDGEGRVRWVDFDSAVTRGYWKIDERCFWMEAMGTLHTLLEDVIPARERGEQPQCEMFSF